MTNVYIAYHEYDKLWLDKLISHLKPLVRDKKICLWHEGELRPGDNKNQVITTYLGQAQVVITLLSPEFMSTDELYNKYITNPVQSNKIHLGLIIRPFYLYGNTLKLDKIFPINRTALANAARPDLQLEQLIAFIHSLTLDNPAKVIKSSSFSDIPKMKLKNIKDLYNWVKMPRINDNRKLFKLIVEHENKPDIYRGFLFPLIQMSEIKEIYYNSTSILWGINSFGESFLLEVIYNILENNLLKNNNFNLIMNTNIDYYTGKDKDFFNRGMRVWEKVFHDKVYLDYNMGIKYSDLYVKVENKKDSYTYFKIMLFNKNMDSFKNIGAFDGKIDIKIIKKEIYKICIKSFKKRIKEAELYKEKGNLNSRINTFGMFLNNSPL